MPQRPDSATAAPAWLVGAPALFLLLWSSGFVFLKLGLRDADPLTFLALRYAIVVALLAGLSLWFKPEFPRTAAAWLHVGMVGLLLQAGYFAFTYLSLKYGMSAGAAALITSQQPILIGLLAPAIAGERVGVIRWVGLALGVTGAAIVILAKSSIEISSARALVFAVLALLSMTGSTLWEKRFGTATHPLSASLVQYGVALLITAPLAYLLEPMRVHWTLGLAGSLAYLVVGNSLLAIYLLLTMIRFGEASRVSALFFLVPPVTAVIALVALGEALPPVAWVGMVLAAIGVYLVARLQK
ncbi:DMT family transporter [Trinickia sp. LjRoot230]|uniref:DMT family transporter n=1 Tax=Trinickia sp. LjRoot230 TaxID=3342288 RepID=UPI003ED0A508